VRRLIVLLLCACSVFAADETVTTDINGYKFVIASSNYGMTHTLTVLRRDKSVWTLEDYMIKLADSDSLGLPKDLTGDRIPDVIIQTFSGGAHCCFADFVLSLGTTFEVIDTLNSAGQWGRPRSRRTRRCFSCRFDTRLLETSAQRFADAHNRDGSLRKRFRTRA
jgi:cephalosporin hydroxylase